MAKVISEDEFGSILSEATSKYIFHREEMGEIKLVFTSPIQITNPGDEDLVGRLWSPPVEDADGNPILEKFGPNKGNPRQPWSKVEAECTISGAPHIYSFGGKSSSSLRNMIQKMNENGIKNEDLPGTKWSINRTGPWDWTIEYLGKVETEKSASPTPQAKPDLGKIKEAISDLSKNPEWKAGKEMNTFIQTLVFMTGSKPSEIKEMMADLVGEGVIVEAGGKVKIV